MSEEALCRNEPGCELIGDHKFSLLPVVKSHGNKKEKLTRIAQSPERADTLRRYLDISIFETRPESSKYFMKYTFPS